MATYENDIGVLKYIISCPSTEETPTTLTATYESHETGISYETEIDDVPSIHKLFAFDDTIVSDVIKIKPTLNIEPSHICATHEIEFANRKYTIAINIPKKESEGEDQATANIQRQNKLLIRRVAKLTDRISDLETQMKKLATCVMNNSYGNEKGDCLNTLCDILGGNNIVQNNYIYLEHCTRKLVYGSFCCVPFDSFAKTIILHSSTNINFICENGATFIINVIDCKYTEIDKVIENFIFVKKHKEIDIFLQSKDGETVSSICKKKIIEAHDNAVILHKWKDFRRMIVAMENDQRTNQEVSYISSSDESD